jgi:hypothetical protein
MVVLLVRERRGFFPNWPAQAKAPQFRILVSPGANRPGHGRVLRRVWRRVGMRDDRDQPHFCEMVQALRGRALHS